MKDQKKYTIPEEEPTILAEPAVAVQNERVSRVGFWGDEFERIALTPQMRESALQANRDYEDGKCLSEEQFNQRFAKWLKE